MKIFTPEEQAEKARIRARKWREENIDRARAHDRERNHTEERKLAQKKYRTENKEHINTLSKEWRCANPKSEYQKEREKNWRKDNSEHVKEYGKNYFYSNQEKLQKQNKEWANLHPEKIKSYNKKYRLGHPEKVKEVEKAYRESHKEKLVLRTIKHRAKLKSASGFGLSTTEWNWIRKMFDYRCAYCGKETKLTVDHVVPLSKGGIHDISNVVPSCMPCNSGKQDRTLLEFLGI